MRSSASARATRSTSTPPRATRGLEGGFPLVFCNAFPPRLTRVRSDSSDEPWCVRQPRVVMALRTQCEQLSRGREFSTKPPLKDLRNGRAVGSTSATTGLVVCGWRKRWWGKGGELPERSHVVVCRFVRIAHWHPAMSVTFVQRPSALATVAHGLRNPLTALQAASEILDRDFDLLENAQK